MSHTSRRSVDPTVLVLAIATIAAFWIVATAIWWAALWHAYIYLEHLELRTSGLGDAMLVISSARAGAPFMLAGVFTVAVVILALGFRAFAAQRFSVLVGVTAMLAAFSLYALSLPIVPMCNEFPDWPAALERPAPTGAGAGEQYAQADEGCVG